MQCEEECVKKYYSIVKNIAIYCDIFEYRDISKNSIFFRWYNTIYRYRKRYIDIFDISNHHCY